MTNLFPLLIVGGGVVLFSLVLAYYAVYIKGNGGGGRRFKDTGFEMDVLEIRMPKTMDEKRHELQSAPISAEQMFASLHGLLNASDENQEHVSFEIVSGKDGIKFYSAVPSNIRSFVESQIYSQYPEAQIKKVDDYSVKPLITDDIKNQSAYLVLSKKEFYPIKTFKDFEVDPLSAVTGALTDIENEDEEIWMQVMIRPEPDVWQNAGYDYVEMVREGTNPVAFSLGEMIVSVIREVFSTIISIPGKALNPSGDTSSAEVGGGIGTRLSAGQEMELRSIEDKLTKLGFKTCIRVVVLGKDANFVDSKMRGVLASFKQYSTANLNSLAPVKIVSDSADVVDQYNKRLFSQLHSYILNTEELASIYHLPASSVETPAINWVYAKESEPPSNLPIPDAKNKESIVILGKTSYREKEVPFGLKSEDRRRHVYAIGKTGVGKSTLFRNMAVQDIYAGRGLAFLDPHGEEIDFLLNIIPEERIKDVVLFDPSDKEYPLALNFLECPDYEQKNLMASGIVEVFKKQFGYSWGPRLEYLLNYSVLTLIEVPGTTLLGVTRLLADTNYQKYILHKVRDPVVKDFWEKEYKEKKGNQRFISEALDPIQNKVGRFLASPTIRNILGQRHSTIRLDEIMNEGKILLINLAKGKIGEDNANLLGALIVSRLSFMAMRRVDIPEEERRDFYLYVDEFQNFASDSFANILSEARKYRLNLNITHQYTAQIQKEMQEAVFGNVGTTISFALGAPDARVLEPEFEPYFDANDLITLEKHHMYIKMMVDGMTSKPFSAQTYPSPSDKVTDMKDRVVEESRKVYGSPVEGVEERIRMWIQRDFDLGMAIAEEKRKEKKENEQPSILGQEVAGMTGGEKIPNHPPVRLAGVGNDSGQTKTTGEENNGDSLTEMLQFGGIDEVGDTRELSEDDTEGDDLQNGGDKKDLSGTIRIQ